MATAPAGLVATPAFAAASSGIEASFTEWKAARKACDTATEGWEDDHPGWKRMSDAEDIILDTRLTGARVAEMRLWIGLAFNADTTRQCEAIWSEDFGWMLANVDQFDSSEYRMILAIKALRGEKVA
ncbi:hypothetical protein [Sphingomonas sp. Leaf17]|uniref:hypothetical protein n=1 Tax=Sphingomonas sp. Leaf17 TaxID=1735683 RepID=UPI00138F51AD|nr:hypothetical protein [Sphingomonas sp. Leaf17]